MHRFFRHRTKTVFAKKKSQRLQSPNNRLLRNAKETLGGCDLEQAVQLPENGNENEWIAHHIIDFRNKLALFFGIVKGSCTKKRCPIMNAGINWQYCWVNNKKSKPQKMPAQTYILRLFKWVDNQINNESLFPNNPKKYPKKWKSKVSVPIIRRLFRVLGHIYHAHFQLIREKGTEAHLNTLLIHFVYFAREFSLLKSKDYLPMKNVIEQLCFK
ncbi:mob kinase activator-like 1 [Anaeramoeba flamelloides]|uniref:Mob kinase activator-like 1 n=1 Tax=Anaeramoeba flamelloides TaxID=1746091 RepID=A0ABQ8X8I2_9EUKA|nr:mob kinase activator-like 1 [Anaeramoeba flamelloides]